MNTYSTEKPISGICRYCRCIESNACKLPDGEACAWFDNERTVCSAPACLAAHFRERERRQREQRPRRRSPAEILEIRKQEQLARRRRARLARSK